MRKLPVIIVLLTVFVWSAISYGRPPTRVLVYKGTIKASKSIFDVNDVNNLLTGSIKAYWAIEVIDSGESEGQVIDSNAVVYDARDKYYKVIYDAVDIDPYDPCSVVMFNFNPTDAEGQMEFYAVGKGKLTKFSNDADVAKDFVPMTLKGTGLLYNYDYFEPVYTCSGPITVTMTLDSAKTRAANPYISSPGEIINAIVTNLTKNGGWTEWPYNPAGPD
jgi:hypothetical protein